MAYNEPKANTKKLTKKINNVKTALAFGGKEFIDLGLDKLNRETTKNLSGWRVSSVPVRRVTGNLAGAQRTKRFSPYIGAVYIDKNKAPYGIYVHEGTVKKPPQPFAKMASIATNAVIHVAADKTVKRRIRKAGRE